MQYLIDCNAIIWHGIDHPDTSLASLKPQLLQFSRRRYAYRS
jgi:hypothetical protein